MADGHPGFGAALVDHQAWFVVTGGHGQIVQLVIGDLALELAS